MKNYEELVIVRLQRLNNEGQHVPMKTNNKNIPDWFDANKFKKGQKYFYDNYYSMFVAKLSGLLLVLLIPSILHVLMLTGKSSTPGTAFKRYMSTISNMLQWYDGDLKEKSSDIHQSLSKVKGKHCAAAKQSVTSGASFISQRDLALTQFGFMGLAVSKNRFLGMTGSVEDLEGFIHFWKTIGYFMGIDDSYNLCAGSVQHVTELCDEICETIFKPLMRTPNVNFNRMADALLLGMKPVVLFMDKDAFYEFTRRIVGLPKRDSKRIYARYILEVLLYVFTVILTTRWLAVIFRPLLNILLRFAIYCNIKLPLVAVWMFGHEVLENDSVLHRCTTRRHPQTNTVGAH